MKNSKPKVSVICITFNHVDFIRQALDGFVMQKTNFPFEVIVHDDASTDGTADIVREYAKKYPDIIKPILQSENQWSRGVNISTEFIWPAVRGEYVAVCDGDDYWTNPLKLQKQADFLDANPDFAICFHPVSVFWNDNSHCDKVWPKRKTELTLQELIYENHIPNCAVMYRWIAPTDEWPDKIYPGDWFMHLLHAKRGKIHFIPDVMARYRRHSGGISFAGTRGANMLYLQWGLYQMNFFNAVERQIAPNPGQYHQYVCRRAREIITAYALGGEFDKAARVLEMCPDARDGAADNRDRREQKKWQRRFNHLAIFTAGVALAAIMLLLKFI